MRIKCILGKHEAIPSDVWNNGFYFSRCKGCECEMIRRHKTWRVVPKKMRVVWTPRTLSSIDWSRPRAAAARPDLKAGRFDGGPPEPRRTGPFANAGLQTPYPMPVMGVPARRSA